MNNLKMVVMIFQPAITAPRTVPDTLLCPAALFRYRTGTSAQSNFNFAARTCISTVQPKFLSASPSL
jgi:hypothetical protein